jgi:hypothetical protein
MKTDLTRMLDHLSDVSVFNHSVLALLLILGLSLALTLLHTLQELKERGGPLWRNFGAVVGVQLPDWLGFAFFFVILTVLLWLVALIAITGSLLTCEVPTDWPAIALGALIGARLGDTLVSHVLLDRLGYRPNPGLASTTLYVAEAVFFIATFSKGLAAGGSSTWIGLVIGAGFFCLVLPLVWFFGLVIPGWRRVRWRSGERPPEWAGITQ